MKCAPGTVTSVWLGQVRQNSRCTPVRIVPGSALTKSLGMALVREPLRVAVDDGGDVGWLAVDEDLP